MKKLLITAVLSFAAGAIAQTCIINPPASPPIPRQLIVNLPIDGGAVGCTISAPVSAQVPSGIYAVGNAKCAVAVAMAQQAAAIDNGWGDGGVP